MRVMVAGDYPPVLGFLSRWFKRRGWSVEAYESGAELAEAARRGAPDLVVSDVHMRGSLDGLEACAVIRRERPATGIILMTGDGDALEPLRESGFPLVLSKPFALEKLQAAVDAGLRRAASS